MSPNHKEMIPQYLQAIAKKEGLSENDVRNEIALAISLALKSNDTKIQNFSNYITFDCESPTIQ